MSQAEVICVFNTHKKSARCQKDVWENFVERAVIELGPDTAELGPMEMEGEEVNTLWKAKSGAVQRPDR